MNKINFLALFLVFLLSISFTNALYVQITTNSTYSNSYNSNSKSITAIVNELNSGNDVARQTSFSIWTNELGLNFPITNIGDLNQNQYISTPVVSNVSGQLIAGTWPFAIITSYSDQNGVIYSSVTPNLITIGQETQNLISIKSQPISIIENSQNNLAVNVYNLENSSKNILVTLVLPLELSSNNSSIVSKNISLGPKQFQTINFVVDSNSAVAPSSYVVGIYAQTYENGIEKTELSKTIINIIKSPPYFLYYSVSTLGLVILVIIGYFVYNKIGNKNGK